MIYTSEEKPIFSHNLFIIDDHKVCLYAHETIFSAFTRNIDSAETVEESLEKLSSKHYDLVVSDLDLSDGSGKDIVTKIKAMPDSPNYKTPFVAITAHEDCEVYQDAIKAGFLIVSLKPLTLEKAFMLLEIYPASLKPSDRIGYKFRSQ